MAETSLEKQLLGAGTLLHLQKQSRLAGNTAELGYLIVTETHRLIDYTQAVLFISRSRRMRIQAVSNVEQPDGRAPYMVWLTKLAGSLQHCREARTVKKDDIDQKLPDGWQEWSAPYGLWLPVSAYGEITVGGLWLTRDRAWQQGEISLLMQLAETYGHAWLALQALDNRPQKHLKQKKGCRVLPTTLILICLVGLFLLPVRLSVLAPARVEAVKPVIVSAPLNGVIKEFFVQPNQQVEKDQPLFKLDDTEIRNRYEVVRKSLAVVEAELQHARQKSLLGRRQSSDVELLRVRLQSKEAEVAFAAEELAMVTVRARRKGITVFSDPNDWLGKPVLIGERIITLADPDQIEIAVDVPVRSAINLESGAEVRLFLDTDPTRYIAARLRQTSYEPKLTADNILAFQLRASLREGNTPLRIGQRGTAKIFGQKTVVFYYIFRRPYAALRQKIGL